MSKPTRIITVKVTPKKLKGIVDPDPLSALDPHAATPATPIARTSNRARQITAGAAASAAQGNTIYTRATFAASFSPVSTSATPDPGHHSSPTTPRAPATAGIIRSSKQKQQKSTPAAAQVSPSPTTSRSAPRRSRSTVLKAPAPEPLSEDGDEDEGKDDDGDTKMTEKDTQKQPAGAAPANGEGGLPFYEEQRKHLQELLEKRNKLAASLAAREEEIARKESEYLDSTPAGNMITGFDNYTKGAPQAAAAQRRKGITSEQLKVFTRSSMTYNPLALAAGLLGTGSGDSSGANTPGSSHAPTPVSSTFGGGGSNHPTPTTGGGGGGGRSAGGGGGARDRKKKHAAQELGDSESDARETKKVRTNFGAGRK